MPIESKLRGRGRQGRRENLQSGQQGPGRDRLSVFKYLETFYNSSRLHQTLGYNPPNQFEAENAPAETA